MAERLLQHLIKMVIPFLGLQMLNVECSLMPMIIGTLEEDSKMTRLMSCRIMNVFLEVNGKRFQTNELCRIYPGMLHSCGRQSVLTGAPQVTSTWYKSMLLVPARDLRADGCIGGSALHPTPGSVLKAPVEAKCNTELSVWQCVLTGCAKTSPVYSLWSPWPFTSVKKKLTGWGNEKMHLVLYGMF